MKIKRENGLLTPYACSLTVLACFLGFVDMLRRSFQRTLKVTISVRSFLHLFFQAAFLF